MMEQPRIPSPIGESTYFFRLKAAKSYFLPPYTYPLSPSKENFKKYLESFKDIYPEAPHVMMNIVQALFPKFSWRTGGYTYNRESNDELRYKDRIASADRIKRYFIIIKC